MGDKLDMALDDIIKSTKGSGRGRGGGGGRRGGSGGRGGGGNRRGGGGRGGGRSFGMSNGRSGMSGRWSHDMFQGGRGRQMAGGGGGNSGKLTIANLDYGVSDSDLKELFREFGVIRRAGIHYDQSGISMGSGEVIFGNRSSAVAAMQHYNGVHLDGRPMKISIEGSGSGLQRAPGARPMVKRLNQSRGGGGGGRGGGGRGRRQGGGDKKPKTAEELDAELDTYLSEASKEKEQA